MLVGLVACAGAPPLPPEATRGFDRAAVAKTLAQVDVAHCEPPLGLKGSSHITLFFEPDGTVSGTKLDDGDPNVELRIILGGTPTGACVERLFREVKVAPFQPGPAIGVGQVVTFGLNQTGGVR